MDKKSFAYRFGQALSGRTMLKQINAKHFFIFSALLVIVTVALVTFVQSKNKADHLASVHRAEARAQQRFVSDARDASMVLFNQCPTASTQRDFSKSGKSLYFMSCNGNSFLADSLSVEIDKNLASYNSGWSECMVAASMEAMDRIGKQIYFYTGSYRNRPLRLTFITMGLESDAVQSLTGSFNLQFALSTLSPDGLNLKQAFPNGCLNN